MSSRCNCQDTQRMKQTNDKKKHQQIGLSHFVSLSAIFRRIRLLQKLNELYREQCSVSMTSINFNENMSSNKTVIIYFEMT